METATRPVPGSARGKDVETADPEIREGCVSNSNETCSKHKIGSAIILVVATSSCILVASQMHVALDM